MKAVGYLQQNAQLGVDGLVDLLLPDPAPEPQDLLVRVKAISVNPRDVKMRGAQHASPERPRILGWDVAGVVEAIGNEVTGFAVGDEVFYAGNMLRQGANAELHCVDWRIVGRKPSSEGFAQAAALPLTTLTAWEMLFDRLQIPIGGAERQRILVLGGAGGVASMAIQLARQLTNITVIATASRPESEAWVRRMGAHHVISHVGDFVAQMRALGETPVDYSFSTHTTQSTWKALTDLAAPQGKIGFVDEPEPLDLKYLKAKSLSVHAEAVFTRPIFQTADIVRQGEILNRVARLVETGTLCSPMSSNFGAINAANVRSAHAAIESRRIIGKIVLEGF